MKNFHTFPQPICEQIWNQKYKLITPNPDVKDDTKVEDTWKRIADACSSVTPEITEGFQGPKDLDKFKVQRNSEFYNALKDFKFLPAGRIIAGAGSGRQVTLFNCYVMGTIPDDISGIFENLREAALTMQQGGGIGYDFSTIRPSGAPVKGVDADASGPLTFMDCWDSMCRTIMSAGARRGAMMATMRCDHPDIEAFITAKRDPTKLRMFNVSVLVTDAFMEAVANDEQWPLCHEVAPRTPVYYQPNPLLRASVTKIDTRHIYKVVSAKDLWTSIMDSTYKYAEPGVLFIDRINKMNNLHYMEDISATNPCGEQPLPPYGACLLGSINLVKMVHNPFSEDAYFDYDLFEKTIRSAVGMLDSIIDTSLFPIEQQRIEAKEKRRMGLGLTGLADMLFMLNLTYGSEEAAQFANSITRILTTTAYEQSIALAKLLGPCPATKTREQREEFIRSGFMQQMPEQIRHEILEHGIRNALLTSIAPTGTISLYAGNVSSGVEPIFAESYTRKVLNPDGTKREEFVEDYAVKLYRERNERLGLDPTDKPNTLVTAQTLSPKDHVVMQAAVQQWVDSSISKTINCPEDISFEDFVEVYMTAYDLGCKGCTTYRPNDVTGSILSVEEPKPEPKKEPVLNLVPMARDKELNGKTYKLKWQGDAIYVTINDSLDSDGRIVPFEIFINSKQTEHYQWTIALTRMISSIFRRGGDITFVIEELQNVFDPKGGTWIERKYVPSIIALIGNTINTHLHSTGYITTDIINPIEKKPIEYTSTILTNGSHCPSCKSSNIILQSGCETCGDCGHSKCG